ncbi:MAG TPA: hypothetical protein VIU34_05650, partial [Steroidobacter sp.]
DVRGTLLRLAAALLGAGRREGAVGNAGGATNGADVVRTRQRRELRAPSGLIVYANAAGGGDRSAC